MNQASNSAVMSVAVIGAGMAGLSAASRFQKAGCDVTVFEKARGSGGRLSSKRLVIAQTGAADIEAGFDLGCTHFDVQSDFAGAAQFQVLLDQYQAAGCVSHWPTSAGRRTSYVGLNRNSALTRAMTEGLNVQFATRVSQLKKVGERWQVLDEAHQALANVDHVVLAVPVQQALDLLGSVALPSTATDRTEIDALVARLTQAYIAPQWVMGVVLDAQAKALLASAALPASVVLEGNGVLAQLTLEHTKPQRGPQAVMQIQAQTAWSEQHTDTPKAEVEQQLLAALQDWLAQAHPQLGINLSDHVLAVHVHRWLYANSSATPLNQLVGRVYGSTASGLHVCGDYWLAETKQQGVQAAFASGWALAQALVETWVESSARQQA